MIDTNKFVRKAAGRFFTVTFRKKDGTIRTLNGRTGVHSATKSGVAKVETDKLFVVYDVKLKQFRSIRKDSIISITTDGFTLIDNTQGAV